MDSTLNTPNHYPAATTVAEMYQNLHVALKSGQQGVIRHVSDSTLCTVQLGAPANPEPQNCVGRFKGPGKMSRF